MELTNFGIKNYRSFDEEGVFIEKIGKINVFIGKNNSGKSNVLRFIKELAQHHKNLQAFPNHIENQFRRSNKRPSLFSKVDLKKFNFPGILAVETIIELSFQDNNLIFPKGFFDKVDERAIATLQKTYSSAPRDTLLQAAIGHQTNIIRPKLLIFFKNVIYIPHFRNIKEHESNQDFSILDGTNIISRMFEMQNPDIGKENLREQFNNIQKFVRELLKIDDLKLEIPNTKDKVIVEMHGNRFPLESFGTGIHQLVILCSALEIYNNNIFCIEEPEIHLHPELQRMFINFLKRTNNTYFITTHSNVFLDFDEDIVINHVTYDGHCSKITPIINTSVTHEILNDLGYKNSDLIQSNGIIWVEGPSDRVFINKWISLIDKSLIEGLHYSIMFYGGRLLSNLSCKPEYLDAELIPLLRINRNAFVVIDKDAKRVSSQLNETKTRIQSEIGEDNCWITKGREIENYLSKNSIQKWLKAKHNISVDFTSDQYEKLGDSIKKSIETTDMDYALKKNDYSKEIVDYIGLEDLNVFDLKEKLEILIQKIRTWNYQDINTKTH